MIIRFPRNSKEMAFVEMRDRKYMNPKLNLQHGIKEYLKMQKNQYSNITSYDVVGNYEWHQKFPYEKYLLYIEGNKYLPIIDNPHEKYALDFGCAGGRMVERMLKIFKRVDGVDISERFIKDAKAKFPNCEFYVTNGNDCGDTPSDFYDFVYSTICIQHIPVREIRNSIFENIRRVLKTGGKFTIQMGYNSDYNSFSSSSRTRHASWEEDFYEAATTNGSADVVVNKANLEYALSDFEQFFKNVRFWLYEVSDKYNNLDGEAHGNYWATHWIFFHGEK